MMAFGRRRALLGAVAAALLGSACKSASSPELGLPQAQLHTELRKVQRRVRRYVDDQDRRYRALALLEDAGEILGRLDVVLLEWREALVLAPDERRRDRAWLLALTETFNAAIAEVLRDAVRVGIALREPIRADEWAKVFPGPDPGAVTGTGEPC